MKDFAPWTDKENADPVDTIHREKASFRGRMALRAKWLSITPHGLRTALACNKTIERAKEAGLAVDIIGEIPDEQLPCAAKIFGVLTDLRVNIIAEPYMGRDQIMLHAHDLPK